jgi:N-acetylglucosamine kinase-like BadF-type ATPase
MTRVLGIDGGQSGTRLRDSDGHEASSSGVSHLEGDTVRALVDTVTAAWRAGRFDQMDRVVLGLTTAPADGAAADRLCAGVAATTRAAEVWLADDAVTSHAGALSLGWGVSVIAGTGVASLSLPEAGEPRILGGHGFLLGDEGGAFWIGRRVLASILRAREGRDPVDDAASGPLSAAAEQRFGSLNDLAGRLHAGARPVDAIAEFARDVFDACEHGDALAIRVVEDAVEELVLLVASGTRWAGADGSVVPLALGGRLLANGTPLRRGLEAALHRVELPVVSRSADRSPVEGAVLLGLRDAPGRYASLVHRWREKVAA